jgi:hypothetical protein
VYLFTGTIYDTLYDIRLQACIERAIVVSFLVWIAHGIYFPMFLALVIFMLEQANPVVVLFMAPIL